MLKYEKPSFIEKSVSQKNYEKWLYRRAQAHIRRDRKKGDTKSTPEEYRVAIQKAVCESKGLDAYTGEHMHWNLISTFNNDEAKKGKSEYKKRFKDMPTVDHEEGFQSKLKFKICAWAVNDAKSDLSLKDFVELCKQIIKYNSR